MDLVRTMHVVTPWAVQIGPVLSAVMVERVTRYFRTDRSFFRRHRADTPA